MDAAILPAVAALVGSLVGGASTLVASWLTQRGRFRAEALAYNARNREALYAEFIIEGSKRVAEAWSRQAESPADIAALYAAVERMRLTSSAEVIVAAEKVISHVVEAYAAPDQSFDDLRRILRGGEFNDPIREFSEVCRKELNTLRR